MEKLAYGNGYHIGWPLRIKIGESTRPIDFSICSNIRCYLVHHFKKQEVPYSLSGDTIHFDLPPELQQLGTYDIDLLFNSKDLGSGRAFRKNAFEIVDNLDTTEAPDDNGNFDLEPATAHGDLYVGLRGRSSYQEWLLCGFVGDENKFMEWLQQPATSAAAAFAEAELIRDVNENKRSLAEQLRITSEQQRSESEQLHITAEINRTSEETKRAGAERSRSAAETSRVGAERTRGENETARSTAEQHRSTKEGERKTAETARIAAEKTRKANEVARNTAESARIASETEREAAELSREQLAATLNNYLEMTKVVESPFPYPTVIPQRVGQRLLDSKRRMYDAVGTAGVQDWEVVKECGFTGVKTGATNLYTPEDVNRTFEYWLNPNPTVALNSIYLQFGTGADYISIFRYASGFHFFVRKDNVALWSYNIPLRTTHIVIDLCSLNSVSIYINEVLKFNADMSGTNLQFSSKYLQNSVSYIIREYNFKPTSEQVREWYNTGRVDKYELPAALKEIDVSNKYVSDFSNSTDGWSSIDGSGSESELSFNEKKMSLHIKSTVESSGRPVLLRTLEFTEPKKNSLFKITINNVGTIGFKIRHVGFYSLLKTNVNINVTAGRETSFIIEADDATNTVGYFYDRLRLYLLGSDLNPSDIIEIGSIKVEQVGCTHEFLPSSIQPHKWSNTGALGHAKDIVFIEGEKRTVEIDEQEPYQEHISGEGAPATNPDIPIQSYLDTENKNLYGSVGVDSAADWERQNN